MTPVRVLICDDDAIVREALGGVLDAEPDITVVAVVATAEHALQLIAGTDGAAGPASVDVVLMDVSLPGMDGIAATRRLRELHPGIQVLVLTTFGSELHVRTAITAGAAGFLLKTTEPSILAAAVRHAAAPGATLLSPEVALRAVSGTVDSDVVPPDPASTGGDLEGGGADPAEFGLSAREAEVLELVCTGENNAGIAAALVLSESTVKSHVSSVMGKLEVSSRLQLALRAFELGLVAAPRRHPVSTAGPLPEERPGPRPPVLGDAGRP